MNFTLPLTLLGVFIGLAFGGYPGAVVCGILLGGVGAGMDGAF